MNKIFILLFLGLMISFVSAVPPQTALPEDGFDIRTGIADTLKMNQGYDFHIHVFNSSNGYPITQDINCTLHLYNSSGHHLFEGDDLNPSHSFDYGWYVDKYNFTEVGYIEYIAQCSTTVQAGYNAGGFVAGSILITTTGKGSGNTLPLFLFLGGFLIFAVALYSRNEFFGYFSGLIFVMAGVYMMIYGLGSQWDIYTQTLSFISLGLGLILMMVSAYETIWGGREE